MGFREPKISCLMMTYNRPRVRKDGSIDAVIVEEAVESFLRQDYPNKELLIFNDTPGQTLGLAVPDARIKIVNLDQRCRTLGHKYNLAIDQAIGHYVTPWDDDDIYLPHRLSACVEECKQHGDVPPALLAVRGLYALKPDGAVTFDRGAGFAADFFDRAVISQLGYDLSSYGSDARTRHKMWLTAKGNHRAYHPTRKDHFYLYRWVSTRRVHLSGLGGGRGDSEKGYRSIGNHPVAQLHYDLQPHWALNYEDHIRKRLNL